MSIDREGLLGERLGAALDQLSPGPLPLGVVIRRGRIGVIKRRALTATAVIAIAATAITVPKLLNWFGQRPGSATHYHVAVNQPGKGSPPRLIASGRISTSLNELRWSASGAGSGGNFRVRWQTYDPWHEYVGGSLVSIGAGSWSDSARLPAVPANPAAIYDIGYGDPDLLALTVRSDVRYLLVSLSNRQTVTLRPVAVLGRGHPGLAAIGVPSNTSITQLTAYSARGEIGYTVPFGIELNAPSRFHTSPAGDFEILRWQKPGQPALPRPTTYRIGHGIAYGAPWSMYVKVGPWGTCLISPTSPPAWCFPSDVSELTGRHAARILFTSYISQQGIAWQAIVAQPSVSYIVATELNGGVVRVKTYAVGGAKLATVVTTNQDKVTGWIAYSATGKQLAAGSFK